jgi:DNA-binding XRE family transcriptional regulator
MIKEIVRRYVDKEKTGLKLKMLRCDNINLRRYICRTLFLEGDERHYCKYDGKNCDNCFFEMDHSISQTELAKVFNTTDSVVANWELGRTLPTIDDLLFYCALCQLELKDILIFD